MLIGAHISPSDPLRAAAERQADVAQFFLSNPRSWRIPRDRPDAEELRASSLPMYVHAPYLVNIASGNPRIRHPSRKMLQETCAAAAEIGAEAVIVHGGYCLEDEDPAEGFGRWRRTLERLETEVPVFLENTAGGTQAMCRHFDVLAQLWEELQGVAVPLGFCLDTCHTHASGEDLATAVERVTAIVGRIDLVHCNDSKDPPGSGRDRHDNLGRGEIDPDLLVEVVRRAGAPVIVETPGDAEEQAADIAWLRERL